MILIIKKINNHSLITETLDTTRVAVVLHVRTKLHRVFFITAVLAEWLRRTLKARVRKSVGSIPTDCIFGTS